MRVIDVLNSPWAITPEKLNEICEIYATHLKREKIDIPALEARSGQSLGRKEQGYDLINGIAIIPVDGVIAKKMNLFSQISGGASTQLIQRDIQDALDDSEVRALILHVDSPGGTVDGTCELAEFVLSVRGTKPIHTLADGCMCSAAYWIGSAADQLHIASKTTQVGSIGVVATHVDQSGYEQRIGIKTTEITSGKYKRIASQYEPLSKEGKQHIQEATDYLYSLFVEGVADNRGVTIEEVLENMADGKVFIGHQSIDAGLVDGVSTLEQLIESLSSGNPSVQTMKAGAADQSVEGKTQTTKEEENSHMSEITVESLEKNHPEIAKHFSDLGIAQGAKDERERIKAVQDQVMPGHEPLVQTLMFDGKTTGPEAAVQILQAEKSKKASFKSRVETDAKEIAEVPSAVEPDTPVASNDNLPFDERIKKQWDADASLRDEFGDDFDAFEAFEKANASGQVKVLGGQ